MKPTSPVVPGMNLSEVVYAKYQSQYQPLPVHKAPDGMVLSRWKLSFTERLTVLFFGDIYLWSQTFNEPMQPVMLQVERPDGNAEAKA
jgi:hypothetical protein